jgi:hypothetical protein
MIERVLMFAPGSNISAETLVEYQEQYSNKMQAHICNDCQ